MREGHARVVELAEGVPGEVRRGETPNVGLTFPGINDFGPAGLIAHPGGRHQMTRIQRRVAPLRWKEPQRAGVRDSADADQLLDRCQHRRDNLPRR